jgi:hypothetical protein
MSIADGTTRMLNPPAWRNFEAISALTAIQLSIRRYFQRRASTDLGGKATLL